MASAPYGAAYIGPSQIWCHAVGKKLAASVNRLDLMLIGADELLERPLKLVGLIFGGVVVDHAVGLGRDHRFGLAYLRVNSRPWPAPESGNHGQSASP